MNKRIARQLIDKADLYNAEEAISWTFRSLSFYQWASLIGWLVATGAVAACLNK